MYLPAPNTQRELSCTVLDAVICPSTNQATTYVMLIQITIYMVRTFEERPLLCFYYYKFCPNTVSVVGEMGCDVDICSRT